MAWRKVQIPLGMKDMMVACTFTTYLIGGRATTLCHFPHCKNGSEWQLLDDFSLTIKDSEATISCYNDADEQVLDAMVRLFELRRDKLVHRI